MSTIMNRFRNDESSVTLSEYLSCFGELTQDLDHWAGYGITTAAELGDYLDGCVAREHPYDDDLDEMVERSLRRRRESNRRQQRRVKRRIAYADAFETMMAEAGLVGAR